MRGRKISLKASEKLILDFKIKLRNDGLSHHSFFSEVVKLYVNSDPAFEQSLDIILDKTSKLSTAKLKSSREQRTKAHDNLSEIIMSEEDKQSIYSLLEQELGEL
tara:strand:+ start:46810 stop:47124 length:315 start_codon:yes stop_codon:yes gene_type:complete